MDLADLSYSAAKKFGGTKFRVGVRWDCEGALCIVVRENRKEVGALTGQYCESIEELLLADAVDCRGPETFQKIERLHADLVHVPFLYIGCISAEGKGRKIALLLLQEIKRAILKMDYFDAPVVCWYAYPEEPIDYNQANVGRLIRYYRQVGAINPCADRQIMLWDPGFAMERFDIEVPDLGAERKNKTHVNPTV